MEDEEVGRQFKDWEEEEEQLAKREFEREVAAVKEDSEGGELPAYMLRLLEQYDLEEGASAADVVSTPPST